MSGGADSPTTAASAEGPHEAEQTHEQRTEVNVGISVEEAVLCTNPLVESLNEPFGLRVDGYWIHPRPSTSDPGHVLSVGPS
jgi:hypothetical protein